MRTLFVLLSASTLIACEKGEARPAPKTTDQPASTAPASTAPAPTPAPAPAPAPAPPADPLQADQAEDFAKTWIEDARNGDAWVAKPLESAEIIIEEKLCGATPDCRKKALALIRKMKTTDEHRVELDVLDNSRLQYHFHGDLEPWRTKYPGAIWLEWDADVEVGLYSRINIGLAGVRNETPRIVALEASTAEILPIDH